MGGVGKYAQRPMKQPLDPGKRHAVPLALVPIVRMPIEAGGIKIHDGGDVGDVQPYVNTPWAGSYGARCRFNSGGRRPIFPAMEQFGISDRAAARIADIIAAEAAGAGASPALRVAVLAGGCSGFQYRFELDQAPQADDLVIEHGGVRVLVDPASLDLLAGGELDFTDELMGSHFAVRNPNAKSACGCGTSFSVD